MSQSNQPTLNPTELQQQIEKLEWYHTLDLGNGIVTPGTFDHRPYLNYYGIPKDLTGKTVLDIGAASGFFSFEMEQRGAQVTAVDLPAWFDHDFGPCYEPDKTAEQGLDYLRDPILFAKRVLDSRIKKIEMSIYDVSPETTGTYDLAFCGSLLLHLTDPIRALWQIQRVTRQAAIIVTVIAPDLGHDGPLARFVGQSSGDVWWIPNRAGLEAMVQSAGFTGWEWFSEFPLDYRNGQPGPYHGVVRAWNTPQKPRFLATEEPPVTNTNQSDGLDQMLAERDAEITRLRELVQAYERGRFIRLMKWLRNLRLEKR